jgi:hypothetical protein
LAEGGGLFLATKTIDVVPPATAEAVAAAVLLLTLARGAAWRVYMRSLATKGAPARTLDVLEGESIWLLSLGLALPTALIIAGFIPSVDPALPFALAGVSVFAAGLRLKFMLVTRAGYNQGFALDHVPRGRGVAERPIQPGWSLP